MPPMRTKGCVMAARADGGVCEIKMDDSGRLTHSWWQTREQVALWNRYGHVALYDDTAVKNRYRMPLGVLAVIDSEYRTRIVGQSITADTTTDTFLWMLKSALESRGGKQPDLHPGRGCGDDGGGARGVPGRADEALIMAPQPEHHQGPR
ncbi:unnamed protein product [Ectocarpus sp. CCAP 1310/34]|nr:unnamed protein product [Ectocarpus sp. CCAP 1310/34]